MSPNRANLGYGKVVATMFTLSLVLSILFSSHSIASGQGPLAGQVRLSHPIFSNEPMITGQINHQSTSNQGPVAGQAEFSHPTASNEVPAPEQINHQSTSNHGPVA